MRAEFYGEESEAVRESLINYICRKERADENTGSSLLRSGKSTNPT